MFEPDVLHLMVSHFWLALSSALVGWMGFSLGVHLRSLKSLLMSAFMVSLFGLAGVWFMFSDPTRTWIPAWSAVFLFGTVWGKVIYARQKRRARAELERRALRTADHVAHAAGQAALRSQLGQRPRQSR